MALDIGLKRTGIAVSDTSRIIASALDTIPTENLVVFLKNYFSSNPVQTLVVGYPKDLLNKPTHGTAVVDQYLDVLKQTFVDKTIVLWDERFTSKMAQASMLSSGATKAQRKQKGNVDKIAATIILQEYMQLHL
jgi:putative holliday junction resolvase